MVGETVVLIAATPVLQVDSSGFGTFMLLDVLLISPVLRVLNSCYFSSSVCGGP